jgi:hypothetical protein
VYFVDNFPFPFFGANRMKTITVREQKKRAKLQQAVDEFNARFPVGTALILQKDAGPIETIVRAAAQVLGGHSAVAWFDGVSGCTTSSIASLRVPPVRRFHGR